MYKYKCVCVCVLYHALAFVCTSFGKAISFCLVRRKTTDVKKSNLAPMSLQTLLF